MSQSVEFGDDGKIYGLLFPMGNPEIRSAWQMSFYSTPRGRKTGKRYLHKLLGEYCPVLRFELTLTEIRERSTLVPFVPTDRAGEVDEHVVNPKWRYKGKRRALEDN
jgi:hypothetical protein